MVLPVAERHFEEAADMFAFFDVDHSGELDQHEFLSLLNSESMSGARRTRASSVPPPLPPPRPPPLPPPLPPPWPPP